MVRLPNHICVFSAARMSSLDGVKLIVIELAGNRSLAMKQVKIRASGIKIILTVLALYAVAHPVKAATAFSSFDSGGYGSGSGVWVVEGFQFMPNVDIFVTELGFFDGTSNGVGLMRSYSMGIVAPDGTVLGETVVPAGTAAPLEAPFDTAGLQAGSGFRYAPLDGGPLALTAGSTYALAVVLAPGQPDPIPLSPTIAVDPAITYLGNGADCCGSENNHLLYPDEFAFSDLGVNFQFTTTLVPVPAALWLFGSALLGLVGVKRRKA